MTRIDFYILQSGGREAALNYCCLLAEKAYRKGHRVFIHTDDAADAAALDDALWRCRTEAFVPHSRSPEDAEAVLIGSDAADHEDVLLNVAASIPDSFSRFKRMAEIVYQDVDCLQASRERYSFYKQRHYPLHTHKITS